VYVARAGTQGLLREADLNVCLQFDIGVSAISHPEDASESISGQISNLQDLQLWRLLKTAKYAEIVFLSSGRRTRVPMCKALTLILSAIIAGFLPLLRALQALSERKKGAFDGRAHIIQSLDRIIDEALVKRRPFKCKTHDLMRIPAELGVQRRGLRALIRHESLNCP
jgi:hypothetical protein